MCYQTLQEKSNMLLEAHAQIEVHSGYYEIWLSQWWNIGETETFAQVCRRLPERMRPQCRSAGDSNPRWDLCKSCMRDLVRHFYIWGSKESITITHVLYPIRRCYSHKIHYCIICHLLYMSLYIPTYGDIGIIETNSVTGNIYLRDHGVDRYRCLICNSKSRYW